jgi:hypothetical protein
MFVIQRQAIFDEIDDGACPFERAPLLPSSSKILQSLRTHSMCKISNLLECRWIQSLLRHVRDHSLINFSNCKQEIRHPPKGCF